jgi:hypothetical protein
LKGIGGFPCVRATYNSIGWWLDPPPTKTHSLILRASSKKSFEKKKIKEFNNTSFVDSISGSPTCYKFLMKKYYEGTWRKV